MTLILSYVDRECIIQVSDRRLTYLKQVGSRVVPAQRDPDEGAYKSVLLDFIVVVGYCGVAMLPRRPESVAELGGEAEDVPMNRWVAEALKDVETVHDVGRVLSQKLADAMAELGAVGDIRAKIPSGLSIVAWIHYDDQRLRPARWQLTYNGKGNVHGDGRYEDDSLTYALCPSEKLDRNIEANARRQLEECLKRAAGPEAKTRVLRETVRACSRHYKTKGRIGEDVIETCIPHEVARAAYAKERFWVDCGVPPKADRLTYRHIRADNTATIGGPAVKLGNIYAWEGFTMDRPQWVQISDEGFQMVYDGTRPDGDLPKPDEPDYVSSAKSPAPEGGAVSV